MSYAHVKRGALITLVYSLSAVIMRGFNFLFLPYCMTILSLSDFGMWDFYQLLFVRLSIVLTSLGICSLQRFYFLHQHDEVKQHQVIGNSIILLLAPLGISIFLYSFICMYVFNDFFMHLISSITFLYCVFAYLSAYFRIKEYISNYLILLCIQNSIASFGAVLGLYYGYGVQSFFYATLFSLIVLLPYFMYLFFCHNNFSYDLLKEQIAYAYPLMIYNVFYISFFLVDRIILKWAQAYELMGVYGILWRFGSIFQVFTMALVAAWPNILFSFSQGANDQKVMKNLILYNASFICFVCLMTVSLTHGLFIWYLPHETHYILMYIPLFFLSLVFFELARLFQSAFLVVKKTRLVPCVTIAVLGIQITALVGYKWWYGVLDLEYFLMINCISCMVYAYAFYYFSQKIFPLIDYRMARLLLLFMVWMVLLYGTIRSNNILLSFMVAGLWILIGYYDMRRELQGIFTKMMKQFLPRAG